MKLQNYVVHNNEYLSLSKNLQIIKNKDKVLIYHKLFGIPMIFDRNILCLIEKFKNPKQNKNIEIKNEDIKFLKEIFFILKLGEDDRKIFEEKVYILSKNIQNGSNITKLDLLMSE